ncbi:MAG: cysteine desulfurase family protein [Patescibacteria group bacterium]
MMVRQAHHKKTIYLDYAATTPVDKQVFEAMKPYFLQGFGNASEIHQWGRIAKMAIEEGREKVAKALGARAKEIIFTSCASESINLAHKGVLESAKCKVQSAKLPHLITSSIEHKAGIESAKHLEKQGYKVTFLPVDKYGMVKISDIEKTIKPETVLVSIMFVNNEVGTIEPIEEIGQLLKKINVSRLTSLPRLSPVYFHTDATQAIQFLKINVDKLGVDLLSLTGHKFYAPKGIGALYIRRGTPIIRQQDGGGQERGLRAGTENVPYIVGLGCAIEMAQNQKSKIKNQIEKLRERLIEGVLKISGTRLTGHPTKRAPHIASFIIEGVEGEAMLLLLDEYGVAASSGSACTTGSLKPSHVLTAMGFRPEDSHGSLRFSLGKDTTEKDIDYVLKILPGIVEKLRKMAPKF